LRRGGYGDPPRKLAKPNCANLAQASGGLCREGPTDHRKPENRRGDP